MTALRSPGRAEYSRSAKREIRLGGVNGRQAILPPSPGQVPKQLVGEARHMLLNGIPLNYLSRWLGHGRIQTTLVYLELAPDPSGSLASVP